MGGLGLGRTVAGSLPRKLTRCRTNVKPRSRSRGPVPRGLGPDVSCAAMLQLSALLLLVQAQLPAPRGYVNDFAGVLDSTSIAHMDAVIAKVSGKTRGEIAAVTLPRVTVPTRVRTPSCRTSTTTPRSLWF